MKHTVYLGIIQYLIDKYDDNSEFYISDLVKAGFKYVTIVTYLKLIMNKFAKILTFDDERKPFKYTLLNRTGLIKAVIKEEIPDFLQDYIVINIKKIDSVSNSELK